MFVITLLDDKKERLLMRVILVGIFQVSMGILFFVLKPYEKLWMPYLQKDVQLLENTQKFALKLISHNWSISYQDLLSLLDLLTLSTRRLHLKLSQVYKIVYNLCHFPDHIFEERQAHSERLRRPLTLHQPFAHSNAYLNSFIPSSVQAWNNLTEQQVTCPSLKSFKSSLL